jgi:hypothetical protein
MSKPVKALGKAVGSVFKAVGNAVAGVVKAVGKVVGAVINFVASPFMGMFGSPGQPNDAQEAERQGGVLIQRQGSNVHVPVVYGYRKLAGTVVFVETGATKNKFLWVAYTFAEGQAAGLRRIFIDDVEIENICDLLNTGYPVAVRGGKYADRVLLQAWGGRPYHGNEYQDFGDSCFLREAPSWKKTHSFNGLVTVFARYEMKEAKTQEEADNNPFGGSIPQIQIELLGRTVASLVTNESESRTYGAWGAGGYTERYSTNPAEILLDYLRNPDYGKGLKNSEIDWASFRTAAAKYNQTIAYTPSASGPYLTTNYIVDTSQSIFSNVKTLLANMRAYLPYQDGKYKLVVEDAGNPTDVTSGTAVVVRSFTKDNIVGNIVYTGIEKSSKYNTVVVKYVDPADKWSLQEAVFPGDEASRQQLIAADGGRENRFEITMGGLTNWVMAFFMARTILLKSRFQDSCTLTVTSEAFDLEPGDNVYINGNILRFGDETSASEPFPWRIVSKKLNDDYTFELGCVRNPEFIYPHVRQSERDRVLPPYIPKNAQIQYAGPGREFSVGLLPPSRIRQAINYSDPTGITIGTPPGFPAPNDPTSAAGGGVGSPTSPTNTTPVNDDPPRAVAIPPLEDQIRIDRADFSAEDTQVYCTLSFLQPGHPMYAGIDLYYKRNVPSETVWTYVNVATVPGEGQRVSVRIGPLIKGQNYLVRTNVRYTNGENSVFVGNTTLTNVGSQLTVDPADSTTRVGPGWDLPTDAGVVRKDALIGTLVGAPILTSGAPSNPRRMNITLTQDIFNGPANNNIRGVNIYWKASTATFWNKNTVVFPDNYLPGQPVTFELPFTLGAPSDPQLYNFCFRLLYDDGFEGTKQFRPLGSGTRVETDNFGAVSFNPFGGATFAEAGREDVSAFRIVTVAEAPPGSVADPRDLTITFNRNFALNANASEAIVLYLNTVTDPTLAWVGARVYFRPVVSGTNPSFQSVDFTPVSRDSLGRRVIQQAIKFDTEYQYVIVPIVYHNGAKVETRQAWFAQGAIHNRLEDGRAPDFFARLNFQLIDTDVALNRIKTVFAQTDPSIQVQNWSLEHANFLQNDFNSIYYRLAFFHQHIANYQGIDVYRRQRNSSLSFSTFWGIGRWEKLQVNTTNSAPNGLVFANLRAPIGFNEFNQDGTVSTLYTAQSAFPYQSASRFDEFFIVVRTTAGVSTKGILLTGVDRRANVISLNALSGKPPPQILDVANYNTYPGASLRNLSDARTPPANNALWTSQSFTKGTYSPISATPTIL